MAKLFLGRTYNRFPSIWGDPDPANNRIFLNNYGHDFTTLSPKLAEIWYWQTRYGTWNHSIDFDNYAPIQLAPGMDGCAFAGGNNDIWFAPGIFNLWMCSLDYDTYKVTRAWKSTSGRVICSYPRSTAASNVVGDWWYGYNMSERSLGWRHSDGVFHAHCYEHTEEVAFVADSWTYVGTTITITKTPSHGLWLGDEIIISGATSSTNPPNGRYVITGRAATTITIQVGATPTGTAGGTMLVAGIARRSWGIQTEADGSAPNVASRVQLLEGYNYAYDDNNTAANTSSPTGTSLNFGTWKFWLGQDGTYAWYVGVTGGTTNAYHVTKYAMALGAGTETVVRTGDISGSGSSAVMMAFPSNLRHQSATQKIFYSGHIGSPSVGPAPMVFEWNPVSGDVAKTDCILQYGALGFSDFATTPTANAFNGNGYNSFWCRPHQFVDDSIPYITFTTIDGYYYANTLRFPTLKSRTWMTYSTTTAQPSILDFHSGINFSINDFPLSCVPYSNDGHRMAIFSLNGVAIYKWEPLTVSPSSWNYTTDGDTAVTVQASDHGFTVGDQITVTGATADANPPNGIYTVSDVPSTNSFVFYASTDMNGIPTGTAGGTILVRRGWRLKARHSVRARGYSVDSMGRLWVTARATSIGRVEIHLITDDIPSSIKIVLQSPVEGTDTRYLYQGSPISTAVLVDAYNSDNERMVVVLDLTIEGDSMEFDNGTSTIQVTTSSLTSLSVPITITGAGKSTITAKAII